jgi:hypothetical protein
MDALLNPERHLMTQRNLSILHAMDRHTVPAREQGDRARADALEAFVRKIADAPVVDCDDRDLAFYAALWHAEASWLIGGEHDRA